MRTIKNLGNTIKPKSHSINESYSDKARSNTDRLLELIDNGSLDKDAIIMSLVKWMSDDDVAKCCKANEIDLFDEVEESLKEFENTIADNPFASLRSNVIEFDDEDNSYYYIDYRDGKMIAGGATNNGIIPEFELDYDNDLSVDENIQRLYDYINDHRSTEESLKESDDTVYTADNGDQLAHVGQRYGVFDNNNNFKGHVAGNDDKTAIDNLESGNITETIEDGYSFDELDRMYTDMWHGDDFDPVEDDEHHANLYGGDRTFCPKCGGKLSRNERGSYCSYCEPWENFDNEEDNW